MFHTRKQYFNRGRAYDNEKLRELLIEVNNQFAYQIDGSIRYPLIEVLDPRD